MAARTVTPNHKAEVRDRIKTSQLLNRLIANALSEKEILTPGQIKSIEILLRKTLPDLSTVTHEGNADKPVTIEEIRRTIVRPPNPNG